MPIVILSGLELKIGELIGTERYKESRKLGLNNKAVDCTTDIDTLGAQGEIAVAKVLGIYLEPTVNTFHQADIGQNIQVRTTEHGNGRLIVRDGDSDQDVFILVRCPNRPEFEVVGWCYGYEAKQDRYLRDYHRRSPAYFVDTQDLHPIDTLTVMNGKAMPNVGCLAGGMFQAA